MAVEREADFEQEFLVKTPMLWAERVKGGQVGVKLLIVVKVSRVVRLHSCEHGSS